MCQVARVLNISKKIASRLVWLTLSRYSLKCFLQTNKQTTTTPTTTSTRYRKCIVRPLIELCKSGYLIQLCAQARSCAANSLWCWTLRYFYGMSFGLVLAPHTRKRTSNESGTRFPSRSKIAYYGTLQDILGCPLVLWCVERYRILFQNKSVRLHHWKVALNFHEFSFMLSWTSSI